jgi:hypothetical protein
VQTLTRRDFSLVDSTLLRPDNANPIDMGEWLMLDSSQYKLIRSDGSLPSWVSFVERGRSDTQAIGKLTVLFLGGYEAETLIYDSTSLVVGSPLMVNSSISYNSLTKSGLKLHGGGSEHIIGYVMQVQSGSYLRFIQTAM